MANKITSREDLIQTIRDAAKPRTMTRTVHRIVKDGDGKVLRIEDETQAWEDPGDPRAIEWLLQ